MTPEQKEANRRRNKTYRDKRAADPERRAAYAAVAKESKRKLAARAKEDPALAEELRQKYRYWKLRQRLATYGLTEAQYAELWARCAGRCAICTDELRDGRGGASVDHCHATGRVRGLLCGLCNTGLGRFRDSPALLDAAKAYLLDRDGKV